ncbi:phosphatidylethanolamine-binding protein 4 [Microcaecilia unicolor]|uniref:Phosphatidylethanolamine-binding protein 4 n=1 Tax=Microcaecilia unicolor TaxID=1415580 RepID=A0A6P7XR86_9AMPH|nr:phosphatidylethanolamine-binding protein 4 [Microcaecilia unicolor]XP_030057899.1 phosphatidylethanolamine-binding protein 4 [Microcaecilia unicolor]XP_030057900.1 phosphatidylethanolamine-binding protein 4 [Microcaecilia unicolor]
MKGFTTVVHLAAVFGLLAHGVEASMKDEEAMCIYERLSGEDADFCWGNLEIIYPDLGDASCMYIPRCGQYRERISKEWGSPKVMFPEAEKDENYVLIMMDPDAPSSADPKFQNWRHWLVRDIRGSDLLTGDLKGNILSEYRRPTPPPKTGYHRYQFLLYKQPANQDISLTEEERATYGSWSLKRFTERYELPPPVATTQYRTANFNE